MTSSPGLTEIATGVWVWRSPWLDVNISVVRGERGLLVVDTHGSAAAGSEIATAIAALGAGPVVEIVNTHAHVDHWFGNHAIATELGGPAAVVVRAHEDALDGMRAELAEAGADAPDPVLLPDATFSSACVVDLGDRAVEVVHPGRGHTNADVVLRIPDVDIVLAGDLVEQCDASEDTPGFGADCFPLDWPLTLDLVRQLCTPSTLVVPGHGRIVDAEFVSDQRARIGVLAETVRDLAGRGLRAEQALEAATEWPFPPTGSVRRCAAPTSTCRARRSGCR